MPRWRALMRYVASTGGEPSIISSRSSPGSTARRSAGRAPFGRLPPYLKARLFLTDVAEDEAPLIYVPGSHCLIRNGCNGSSARARPSPPVATACRSAARCGFRPKSSPRSGCLSRFASPFPPTRWSSPTPTASTPAACRAARPFAPRSGPTAGAARSSRGPASTRSRSPVRRPGGPYGLPPDRLARRAGLRQQHWKPTGRKRATDR